MVYKKILHISDIHIKLQKGHEEYREVFKRLYEKISNYNYEETLIVITGDILHDRISLTPESIILCTEFLKELSSRLKTILIAGNHDGFLNSSERIDNISGVLYGKDIKDLYYLKDSGIYEYENILIGVSSVFQEEILSSKELDNYIESHGLKDRTKIALYHGGVGSLKLQNLYMAKGEKTLDDFIGYDYTLLGDIHLHQYLDKEKRVGYAGSLISQNYGECDDNHGYILWDIEKGVSHFEKIKNEYQYKTCFIEEENLIIDKIKFNIVEEIEDIKKYLPSKGKVQVTINDKDKEIMKFLKNRIKDVYWNEKGNILKSTIKENETKYDFKINRKEIINEILKTKYNKDIKTEIIDWIDDELKTHDNKINKEYNSYEILNLKFENLFIYGEDNEIDLTQYNLNQIILISGKNSTGKSSLIDIIMFNLYNEYARVISSSVKKENSGILNNGKNNGYSELKIKIEKDIFIIRREYKRNKKGLIETSSYLYKLVNKNENIENINNNHKKKQIERYEYMGEEYKKILLTSESGVTKEIINMIGSKENFMQMNMLMQHDNISFKNKNQSERKTSLYKLLNLDKYEKIKTDMEDKRKKINKEYDILDLLLKDIDIFELTNEYNQNIKDDQDLEKEIVENNKLNEILTIKYQELMKNHMNVNLEKIKRENVVIQELNNLKIKINDYEKKIEIMDIKELENNYKQKKEINENKEKELNIELENKLKLQKNLFDTKYELNQLDIEYKIMEKQLKEIEMNKTKKELLSNEYRYICEEYNKIQNSINVLEHELSSISSLPKLTTLKSEEEYKDNEIKIQEMENDIFLTENRKNLLIKSIEEEDKNNIEAEYKSNEENKLEKRRINIEITQKIKFKEELDEFQYNPECEYCIRNPKVKELLKIKIELDLLTDKYEKIILKDEIEKRKVDYDKNKEELNLCYKKVNEYTNKIKIMIENKNNYENKVKEQSIKERIKKYDLNGIYNRKIIKENEINEYNSLDKKKYELINKLKELDDEKDKIEKNKIIEEEKKIRDEEIFKIRNEIYLNKKIIEETNDKYLKNKELLNFKLIDILKLDNFEKELIEIKYEKQLKQQNEKIKIDIDILQQNLKELNDIINKFKIEQYIKKENKNKKEIQINNYKINIEKIKEVENQKNKYEYYKDILDKDGISIYIIKKYLLIITDGINEIIKDTINKRINIYEDSDKIMIDIYNENNEIVHFVGGMESFIIDLSIKLVLSRILEISRSNFIIIDEGISSFDKEHLGNIEELFVFLKNYYEIIFIMSHIEGIKDYVDKQIVINNKNGLSKILK
jgi:DNA repair exonuclease SbcCD ATPase subunit